jgi:tetratricopeptide (TPR) repeat protein
MRIYVAPAAEATNEVDRAALLDQAEAAYQKIADEYTDVPAWAANAWRTLGQLKIQRGRLRDGLYCYEQVGRLYPAVHWEVIQAWKAAADALWMRQLNLEAIQYYQKIVLTYGGKPGQPPMFETIVDIARSRLREPPPR